MPVGAWELEYGCNVIADPNRVSQYVSNAQDPNYCVNGINLLNPVTPKWSYLNVEAGCDALQWTFDGPAGSPQAIAGYTTPAVDKAPWYSSLVPESAHFWGWMLERVEEVSTPPISRKVVDRVAEFGGASLGRLRRRGRTMKFTLIGFGSYELAMDYGFRWLTDLLTSQEAVCATCDMTFRTSCPPISNPPSYQEWDTGRWTFKDVGIVDGPHYEDPPNGDMACNMRRVSFTVVAQVPYAYKCPVLWADAVAWIPTLWADGDPGCPPLDWVCAPTTYNTDCVNVTGSGTSVGEDALVIQVQAGFRDILNVTIKVTPNPFNLNCLDPSLRYPCDTVVIPMLPARYRLNYDGTNQTITVTRPDGVVEDGTPYIYSGSDPPSFPVVRGNKFCVCITSDRCSWSGDDEAVWSVWLAHRELGI